MHKNQKQPKTINKMDYKVSVNKSAFKIYNKKYKKKMNTNKLTLRGRMLPAVLNVLPELVLVAQMHMYF